MFTTNLSISLEQVASVSVCAGADLRESSCEKETDTELRFILDLVCVTAAEFFISI